MIGTQMRTVVRFFLSYLYLNIFGPEICCIFGESSSSLNSRLSNPKIFRRKWDIENLTTVCLWILMLFYQNPLPSKLKIWYLIPKLLRWKILTLFELSRPITFFSKIVGGSIWSIIHSNVVRLSILKL